MAQIWVSYEELADLCECDPLSANFQSARLGWPRRLGGDGVERVMLPADLAYDFIANANLNRIVDAVSVSFVESFRQITNPEILALPSPVTERVA